MAYGSMGGIGSHGYLAQSGDLQFDRTDDSEALGLTYETYWREASSFYISQSSHPVWFDARVEVNILPGYRSIDLIRRLDTLTAREGMDHLFNRFPPDRRLAARLPATPAVVEISE